jgi:hypothetical protein
MVPTYVFTQEDLEPEYRGTVWDCRSGTPVPADFEAPIKSPWRHDVLDVLLDEYPDQELRSFVTRGTSSKTSEAIGLVMVLGPHLQSLATAFDTVAATIAKAVDQGVCSTVDLDVAMSAFVPGYSIPQGAVAKKDGDDRRTSDYGCPRKETFPRAWSINVATRLAQWPHEVKPSNAELAAGVAVLRYAADVFDEDLFVFSEDIKARFNQFGVHGSEWFK